MSSSIKKISSYTWFQVFVACLSLFALGWMDNARGPFFPLLLENTSSSSSEGAYFFALASFIAILSSACAGQVITRFGLKTLLILGGSLMTLCPLGLVFLPDLTGALITAFLFGASLGFVAVGQNVLVGKIENTEFKRRFFSLLHCFYALAAMTAPLSVLYLKELVSWNHIFLAVSFLTLPFIVMVFFIKSENKNTSKSDVAKVINAPSIFEKSSFLWILFMCFYVSSELILSTRMVVLVKSFGLSFRESSHHLFYFFIFMFLARLVFFLFQFKSSTLKILSLCICGGFISSVLGFMLNPFFFSLVGGFMGPVFPTVMEEISRTWSDSFDAMVSRLISLSSFFVVITHMSVGRLTDLFSVQQSLIAVPTLLFLSFLVLMYRKIKLI